jgi:sugar/nucleoside kinase (ribokinase family)
MPFTFRRKVILALWKNTLSGKSQALSAYKNELLSFLKNTQNTLQVAVMPDYFQDRIVNLEYSIKQFSSTLKEIAQRKGGSIDQIPQTNLYGGNAINVSFALAALGCKVTPIAVTDKSGKEQLRLRLKKYGISTAQIKVMQKASKTTALEFNTANGKTNLMLRDLGSLSDFGPSNLTKDDYEIVENADYVCIFNWAGTKTFGTELAKTVFNHAKIKGKAKTYYDTADPTPNKEQIPQLIEQVLKTPCVDILSLNENEAVQYASAISHEILDRKQKIEFNELALKSAQILAKHFEARIDLHTTTFSATITKKHAVLVPAYKINAQRATGAGDAWDAGNIIGDANHLTDECRLALANVVAACYLSNPDGAHPNRQELAKFIHKTTPLQ